ncbi:MAG: hypothetical protein ACOC56_04030 [Atribacterota bacterium]
MPIAIEVIWKSLDKYAEQYIKFGSESVYINNHTHRLGSEAKPPKEVVEKCIKSFVEFCKQDKEFWSGQIKANQILDTLVGFARTFPKQKEGTKAIIVDFINYIGTINGINYSLRTSEL